MLDLQQQLCDSEAAAESLRIANNGLTSKVEGLEASAGQAGLWRQSKVLFDVAVAWTFVFVQFVVRCVPQSGAVVEATHVGVDYTY